MRLHHHNQLSMGLVQWNQGWKSTYTSFCSLVYWLPRAQELDSEKPTFLVTADVSSLYTIIRQDDAFLVLNWALSKREGIPHSQKVFLGKDLDFCIFHNYFWFQGHFYSQQVGIAMGAKFAPSLANLFIAEWGDRHVFSVQWPQLKYYRRFINDLLFIWEGSEESVYAFLSLLNTNGNNIHLDYQVSDKSINFLDVTNDKFGPTLNTKVYFKPIDWNSYLSVKSGHHPAWIKNIVVEIMIIMPSQMCLIYTERLWPWISWWHNCWGC